MKKNRLALLAVATLVVLGTGYMLSGKILSAPAPVMMIAAVAQGDLSETVLASGTLKPAKLVAVGAQVSGRVTNVAVSLGQKLKAGDLIAEIDSVTQQNALRTSKASLANVQAQQVEKQAILRRDQLILDRRKSMVSQKIVSQAEFEAAEADVASTQAQIDALDAQIISAGVAVETAQANLGYTRITAPIDGTVLAVVSQQGQTVNANQSAPTIVILGQLDVMTVRAEISEADIVKVQPGQSVYFTILGNQGQRYEATLESIEPAPESIKSDSSFSTSTTASSASSSTSSSSAIYYNGIFNVPNTDGRLRTYMTAEVHIVLGQAKGALTIPAIALGKKAADGSYPVQVIDAQAKITTRSVTVGLNDKTTAEIRSGLELGERVVTGQLTAGGTVEPTRRPGPPMGF